MYSASLDSQETKELRNYIKSDQNVSLPITTPSIGFNIMIQDEESSQILIKTEPVKASFGQFQCGARPCFIKIEREKYLDELVLSSMQKKEDGMFSDAPKTIKISKMFDESKIAKFQANSNKESVQINHQYQIGKDKTFKKVTTASRKLKKTSTNRNEYTKLTCDQCGLNFTAKNHLKIHRKSHMKKCSLCEFEHRFQYVLNIHMRTHTGEKPYSCQVCEKQFIRKSNLAEHLKTHTSVKPYSCSICDYKCRNRYSLKPHMKTHTGEKPFSCTICEYKGASKHRITRHELIHTGAKLFSCTECAFKCIQGDKLKTHMMRHRGEKPYECVSCEYKCVSKDKLTLHMKTHTGEKSYACTICEYKCITSTALGVHVKRHFGDKKHA